MIRLTRRRRLRCYRHFCSVAAILVGAFGCNADDIELISRPSLRGSNLAIAKDKTDVSNYFFVDTKSGKRLGDLLGDLRQARINSVEASWSPDGSKVAVFISYGTKLNTVFIYSLGEDNKMKSVELPNIDPLLIYNKRDRKKYSSEAPGYDENGVGKWLTKDTIQIVRGEAKEYENTTKHFLVILNVKIADTRAEIAKLSPVGVFSDEEAEKFLRNWRH